MTEKIIPIPPPPPNPPIDQVPRPPAGNKTTDYYTSKKKIIDFCLGFFGSIIFYIISWTLVFALDQIASFTFFYGFVLIVLVLAIIFFRRRGRRFIAIGIIWAIVAPILILGLALGACFIGCSRGDCNF